MTFIAMTVLQRSRKATNQKYYTSSLIQQPLGNDLPHHLRAAGGNSPQAVVAGESLYRQLTHVPQTAVHLDRLVANAIRHLS